MGIWEGSDNKYCPFCKKETDCHWWDDGDEKGCTCDVCENEIHLPIISIDEPFYINDTIYIIHQGNDDERRLEKWDDK